MSSSAPADGGTDVDLVLSVLDDEGSRALLLAADEHRSAQELADLTDIPNSTVYRKLDRLSAAGRTPARSDCSRSGSASSPSEACWRAPSTRWPRSAGRTP